jgi:hypothetical protein
MAPTAWAVLEASRAPPAPALIAGMAGIDPTCKKKKEIRNAALGWLEKRYEL